MKEERNYYRRSHRRDDRMKVAEAYRIEAERAEASRMLKQAFKDLDSLFDPVEDYDDFTEKKGGGNR